MGTRVHLPRVHLFFFMNLPPLSVDMGSHMLTSKFAAQQNMVSATMCEVQYPYLVRRVTQSWA